MTLKFEGQHFTLVKVQLPPHLCTPNSHFATFKVTRRTPLRSALKRLYMKFCESHDVLSYIIAPHSDGAPANALDIDSFLTGPVGPSSGPNPAALRLVYRAPAPKDPAITRRTVAMNVMMRAMQAQNAENTPAHAYKTVLMYFDPAELVAKCVRQLDVVAGSLDVFGHYGFFVVPPALDDGEDHGYWLMENRYYSVLI